MIVVADSSPFIVLLNIGHVEVLPALYGQILIPPEVETELGRPNRPEPIRALIATPPAWLAVRTPISIEAIPDLHAGEAAAIALARELQADRLIIDEMPGREAATRRGVPIIGTVGVLELAAEAGFLDLERAFEAVKQTDFWVSPKFLDERLVLFRKRRPPKEQGRPDESGGGTR